jgi:MFS family permease
MGKVTYRHILMPTFLYFMVLFGCYPLQVQVIVAALCRASDDDDGDCDGSEISSKASMINVYTSIASYAPTILMTGIYGSMANKYGRKPVLCIAIVGIFLSVASSLFVVIFHPSNFVPVVVLGAFLIGICGGYSTFIMAIFAYASDTTADDPAGRKLSYPITEGAIFLPKLIAPISAGVIASIYGYSYPLVVGMGLSILAFVWVLFTPESLPLDSEVRQQPLSLSPLTTFQNIAFIFKHKSDSESGKSAVPYVAVAFCIYYVAYVGSGPVLILYAKHTFNWGPDFIGYFDGVEGGVHAISMLFFPLFVHYITGRNFKLISWIQVGFFCR